MARGSSKRDIGRVRYRDAPGGDRLYYKYNKAASNEDVVMILIDELKV